MGGRKHLQSCGFHRRIGTTATAARQAAQSAFNLERGNFLIDLGVKRHELGDDMHGGYCLTSRFHGY